jgi:hypothetical protein
VNEPKHLDDNAFESKIIIIPKAIYVEIQNDSSLTVAKAKEIENTYAKEVSDKILASVSELNEEMYFVCGGFSWEEDPEELSSMQLIGVTEKWIPINGTVTKVLHFRLRK